MKKLTETFGTAYFGQGPFGSPGAGSSAPTPASSQSDDSALLNGAMVLKRTKRGRKRVDDTEVLNMAVASLQQM